MIIEIPIFDGGLLTNVDPEDIPKNASSDTENFDIDVAGKILKRKGLESKGTLNGSHLTQLFYWVDDDLTGGANWVGYESQSKEIIKFNKDFTNKVVLKTFSSNQPSDIKIIALADSLRFANGHNQDVGSLQYIDRTFIWDSSATQVLKYDSACPSVPTTFSLGNAVISQGNFDPTQVKTIKYKAVPVFDGNQEMQLPESKILITLDDPADADNVLDTEKKSVQFDLSLNNSSGNWNERISSINIYRATASPTQTNLTPVYRLIQSQSTTKQDITTNTGTLHRNFIYLPDGGLTDIVTGLTVNTDYMYLTDTDTIPASGTSGYTDNFTTLNQSHMKTNHVNTSITGYANPLTQGGAQPNDHFTVINDNLLKFNVWDNTGTSALKNMIADTTNGTTNYANTEGGTIRFTKSDGGTVSVKDFTNVWFGTSMFYNSAWDWDLGELSNHVFSYSNAGTYYNTLYVIKNSYKNVIVVEDFAPFFNSTDIHSNYPSGNTSDYLSTDSNTVSIYNSSGNPSKIYEGCTVSKTGNAITLTFADNNQLSDRTHPLSTTKNKVNYSHGSFVNGRFFAGNVTLDPDDDAEKHDDFIIFSLLNQPDILPITNFIQLKDSQGGQIMGMRRLNDTLVVLMERGIYQLYVPSSNPESYSLREGDANIGCIASNSIVEAGQYIFFAGNDNIYMIGGSGGTVPVSTAVKDVYTSSTNLSETRGVYDPLKNRILFRFGSDGTKIYALDYLKIISGQEVWNKMTFASAKSVDLMSIDADLKIYTTHNES